MAASTATSTPAPAALDHRSTHHLHQQRLRVVSATAATVPHAAAPVAAHVRIGRQRYEVREKLAGTLFGGVYLCEDAHRHDHGADGATGFVAIKHVVLERAKHALQTLAAAVDNPWVERSTLVQLARLEPHANILRVRDEFIESGAWFVVMDHCEGGDLLSALQRAPNHRFPEPQAMALFTQIARGVHFLHSNGIAHRDLSLENVLLQDGVCKISDFGLSTDATRVCDEKVGKAYYMAPEVVAERAYDPAAADMWSLGIMLFIMLTGSPLVPSACDSDPAFTAMRKFGVRTVLQVWEMEFSADATAMLEALLEVDPTKRCRIDDVMAHPSVATL